MVECWDYQYLWFERDRTMQRTWSQFTSNHFEKVIIFFFSNFLFFFFVPSLNLMHLIHLFLFIYSSITWFKKQKGWRSLTWKPFIWFAIEKKKLIKSWSKNWSNINVIWINLLFPIFKLHLMLCWKELQKSKSNFSNIWLKRRFHFSLFLFFF